MQLKIKESHYINKVIEPLEKELFHVYKVAIICFLLFFTFADLQEIEFIIPSWDSITGNKEGRKELAICFENLGQQNSPWISPFVQLIP